MFGCLLAGILGLALLALLIILLTDGRYFGRPLVRWLYDRFGPAIFAARSDRETWLALARRLPLKGSAQILDVGTALGDLPLSLVEAALVGRAIGVDLSRPLMSAARRQERARRLDDRVHFVVADLGRGLPFGSQQMDVVFCLGLLETVPRPEQALAELRRVLRPGGTLVVSVYRGPATLGAHLSGEWYQARLPGSNVEEVALRRSHDVALLRLR